MTHVRRMLYEFSGRIFTCNQPRVW